MLAETASGDHLDVYQRAHLDALAGIGHALLALNAAVSGLRDEIHEELMTRER
jgi:hypothetical protein